MVLVIHTAKQKAQSICDIFYYMGVISYPANAVEGLTEISDMYRAVLIIDPEKLPDINGYLEKLRSYNTHIPIFAISDSPNGKESEAFDGYFPNDIYSSKLVEEIVRYQKNHCLPITSQYRLAGIDASCDKARVSVFDEAIEFTKTETMILRYLMSAYPRAQSSANILRYAFKPLRKPEETSIRTHISIMNKKFREARGRNLFCVIDKGYSVSTPEILKEVKDAKLITV